MENIIYHLIKNTLFILLSTTALASNNFDHLRPEDVSDNKWSSLKMAVQESKLLPEPAGIGGERSQFGFSVSVDGDWALVGAPGLTDAGAAFVMAYDGLTWQTATILSASDGAQNDNFGYSVSLNGNRALISAINDVNGVNSVYVFDYVENNWLQSQKLTSDVGSVDVSFGQSVSLAGDRALIGAYRTNDNGVDSGSAYVFDYVGGSWSQSQILTAGDGVADDRFGYSVSLSGNRALVGAYGSDENSTDSGSAYVFDYVGGSWTQSQKLTADDAAEFDYFGFSVSLSGDRALVGAYRDNDNGFDSGSAYVYDYAGGSWSQSQKLTANDDQAFDQFGFTVVLSGNRLLIGSIRDDDNGIDSGSAYVYDYVGGSWSLSQKINPNDGSLNDHFAHAISLAGDRVLVGVYRDDDYGIESGSAYVYDYVAGNWSQSQKLSAGDGAARDSFGYSVSLSGARALVGAFQDNDDGNNSGAAYIYDYTGSSWSLSQKLTAGDAQLGDEFGYSVSLSGDRALISALRDDDNGNESGSVYVFDYAGGSWSESEKITADDGTANDWFGSSVSLSGNRILVGARLDDDNGSGSGSAYVFDYVGGSWSQSQKLIAADGAAGDYFGFSVSLSGDRALVGAFKGDDIDNGNESGSAYVFDFAAGSWSQTQKITANDGSQGDQFGVSVSLSGDRALIGAYLDDDAFSFSGSAYVFDFVGGSWLQSQKLIASDAAFGDYFGYSVSLEGDRALIGSYLDDDNGSFSGSAYVFEYVDGSWSESQKMISSDGASNDFLGISVSLSGDRVLLGAYADDDNGNNSGAAYVFNLDPQYEVNVSVTGLAGGSLNLINGGDDIAINADGTQTLSVLSDGSPFDVDITAQPTMPNQVCSFTNDDSGTINGMDATVTIHCETIQYDVNINVSGLLGDGVSISNVGDTLTINTDGIETISTFDDGSAYAVLLTSQPSEPNQVCTISGGNSGDDNGSGTLVGTDVTIEVDCVTEQYSIGVEVSGLTSGNSLILQNNGSDDLTVTENGASFFATTLDDGSAYLVSVNTQPTEPNQTCVVSSPMGNLNGGDVGLMVTCSTNQYSVGGMVSGLATGNFVTLSMNGGFEYLVVDGNSYFEFNHSLEDESSYSITVFNNPTSPNQTCDVTNGVGTLMGGDVIDIEIDCEINQYFIGGYATNLIPDNNLLLQNNDSDDLVVPESGAFAFKTPLADEQSYAISIHNQPTNPIQSCEIFNDTGNLNGDDIDNVFINCEFGDDLIYRHGFDTADAISRALWEPEE